MSVLPVDVHQAAPKHDSADVHRPFGRQSKWVKAPQIEGCQLALLTACDSAYIDFAASLVRSIEAFSPGQTVILHLVNPTDADLNRVKALSDSLGRTQLAVSAETIALDPLSGVQRRAYYASARFLRLLEILPELAVPVLMLDADSLVVAPIDRDFSDKPTAEFCLVRRDIGGETAPHLQVANGSIWCKPTRGVLDFLAAVVDEIVQAFEDGSADWYVDQIAVARQMRAFETRLTLLNLKRKYADWTFGERSIVWAGKGPRKYLDPHFSLLQRALLDDPQRQLEALKLAAGVFPLADGEPDAISHRFARASRLAPPRVTIFMPRLDQPWGAAIQAGRVPPAVSAETIALRLHWKDFVCRLSNAVERAGVLVEVVEVPNSQITTAMVDASGAQLALVPHRCRHDHAVGRTPVMFYMQEFYRWVFVVDAEGWSAASSVYPLAYESLPVQPGGIFEEYVQRLANGQLASKFGQPPARSRDALLKEGQIPSQPYIFFPLQIPHDQSIRLFSDFGELEVVQRLLGWAHERGVAVVLKPHPVNPRSMIEFETLARTSAGVHWSQANVQDLIAHARAVYTVNSGVGFEALMQVKPIVTFGRVEYDCVAIRATPDSLDEAWEQVLQSEPAALRTRYARFVDWFLGEFAVDMSLPTIARRRLDRIAIDIALRARTSHAMTAVAET